jgi:hypothetical protein
MAGPFTKFPTALDVVQAVQGQLALPVSPAAITAPNDETAQQLIRLLTWSGRRLCKPTSTYRWSTLVRTFALLTNPVDTIYDLPADWDSFEDLTGWNFTSRLPMLGPATNPQWACLKARNLGSSTISVIYRVQGGKFEIYNTFSDPQDLRIDYSSRAWVQDAAADPAEYRDFILKDDDILLLDNELLTAKLKLAFLTAKGFDTTAAQGEYNEIEEAAICADADAPVLQVSRSDTYPLISTQFNVPDTGFGG